MRLSRTPLAAFGRRNAEPVAPAGPLLDSALLAQLELLSLDSLGSVLSLLDGEHPGAPRARLAELSDYRGYQSGDDPRLIDWNAYARLDELVVRTSAAHEGLLLTLLVDCSRSMSVPGPAATRTGGSGTSKLRYAQRLTAAFGAVALLHGDAVRVGALAGGSARVGRMLSGRGALGRLLDELERMTASGRTDLTGSVLASRAGGRQPTAAELTVLVSDLLVPVDQDAVVDLLGRSGTVLHVADRADADPFCGEVAATGSVELRDSETGAVLTVAVTPALRRRYAELVEARRAQLASRCAAAGVRYVRADAGTPVADLLFGALRG